MNNVLKKSNKRSKNMVLAAAVAVISTLLMMATLSTTIPTPSVTALDLDSFGIDDIGQSAECVIVVVGCDGTGSVGSSGDTIIGSFNGNNNNNTNGGGEPGTLTVTKIVTCESNVQDACAQAVESGNLPTSDEYPITVTGNNPSPSNFPGSSTGTPVTIGAGEYSVDETLASTSALEEQFPTFDIRTVTTATGDCTPVTNDSGVFQEATGTMPPGGSQECTIENEIQIAS